MQRVEEIGLELQLPKSDKAESLYRKYCGWRPWTSSKSSYIIHLIDQFGWHDETSLVVPQEILDCDHRVIIHFREDLQHDKVQICTGLSGKPMKPYFMGQGLLHDGALFSVPRNLVVVSAELQGEKILGSIRQYSAYAANGMGELREHVTLKDAAKLPNRFRDFALPWRLAREYLLGTIHRVPLYWDMTDRELRSCYGDKVRMYCSDCDRAHLLPIDQMLYDREIRLIMTWNYGCPHDIAEHLPKRLCPSRH